MSESQGRDDEQPIHTAEKGQDRNDLRSETGGCGGGDTSNAPDTDPSSIDRARHITYTENGRGVKTELQGRQGFERGDNKTGWDENWLEVATELCGVDDGLPVELDGFKLTKAGHRVQRLKALGNAIVPQVVIEIMKAIKANNENPCK